MSGDFSKCFKFKITPVGLPNIKTNNYFDELEFYRTSPCRYIRIVVLMLSNTEVLFCKYIY